MGMADDNGSYSEGNAAATTGFQGVGSGSKDGGCAEATAVASTAGRDRAGATQRQQQQQDQRRRCEDSCEEDSKGEVARQGQRFDDKSYSTTYVNKYSRTSSPV